MISEKKKICIITPALKMGGVERASINYAHALLDLGHQIHIIALFNQEKFFDIDPQIKFIEPLGFNYNSLSFYKTIRWLRNEICKINPDAVFVLGKFYSAMTLLALLSKDIPVFISERSSPFYKWPFLIRHFSNTIFKIIPPKAVVCQTSTAKEIQKKMHRSSTPLFVVPNPLRQIEKYSIVKENIILAVGRFNDPNKGFDRLVEAFSLTKQTANWKLVFSGGNEEGDYLKQQAKKLGVYPRIIFEGKAKNVDYHFSRAKIFVIPSRSEGFPNALCEAMAHGLACVSFDFDCGPKDLINHGYNGLIVKDGDIIGLANSIDQLITNEKTMFELGSNAIRLKEKLDSKNIALSLNSIFFNS